MDFPDLEFLILLLQQYAVGTSKDSLKNKMIMQDKKVLQS